MWFLYVFIFFVLAVALHAGLCHSAWRLNAVFKFLISGSLAGFLLIWFEISAVGLSGQSIAGILFYAFICEFYIFCFTFVSTSVSVSLVFTLLKEPKNEAEIDAAFSSDSMVGMRLKNLEKEGLIKKEASGYSLTQKGKRLIDFFKTLQGFFGHSEGPVLAPRSSKA